MREAPHPVTTAADPRAEIVELATLRDVLRYAVSCFGAADLHFGHGSPTALDEAVFLILETLNLPIDDFNSFAYAIRNKLIREISGLPGPLIVTAAAEPETER